MSLSLVHSLLSSKWSIFSRIYQGVIAQDHHCYQAHCEHALTSTYLSLTLHLERYRLPANSAEPYPSWVVPSRSKRSQG